MAIPSFVDRARLTLSGGNGGHGCASIRREKFKPLGGPDGGNGGNGGSIILKVDEGLTTLVDYHRVSHKSAPNGQPGMGDCDRGANGADVYLMVPEGTVVSDAATGEILADLTGNGAEYVVANGGRGGLGNAALASPARKAPGFALLGEEGESREVVLELKVMADVGLVGFPSAGKSSLIAAISRARPKIADYPFTTLIPNLGVVVAGDVTYTVADVPGLIEGAHLGKGLGHEFLRHIERCLAIVHIVDMATYLPGRDPLTDLEIIENELVQHGGLEDRPRMIALNKIDVPDAKELVEITLADIQAKYPTWPVFAISTKSAEGLKELTFAMASLVQERRAALPVPEPERIVITPKPSRKNAKAEDEFEITFEHDVDGEPYWRVRGVKPERWVRQTDFNNLEAVGYLGDRLNRLGVEQKLLDLGAREGDTVAIGPEANPVAFDFEPSVEAGAEILAHRGEDQRLLPQERPAAQRRRHLDAEYHRSKADGTYRMGDYEEQFDDE